MLGIIDRRRSGVGTYGDMIIFRYNPGDSTMIVARAVQGLGKTI